MVQSIWNVNLRGSLGEEAEARETQKGKTFGALHRILRSLDGFLRIVRSP